MQKKGELVYFEDPYTKSWKTMRAPTTVRHHLADCAGTDRFASVVELMLRSRGLVERMSTLLFQLFGNDSSDLIVTSTSHLLMDMAIEDSSQSDLNQMAFSIYETLNDKYKDMPLTRRAELVSRLFGDSVCLEVEMMGWREFVNKSAAIVVDSRYNEEQKSPEYLFVYKGKHFLVARCGTGKAVVLPIGAKVSSCEQAQRWISGDTVVGMPLPSIKFIGRH